MAEVVGSNTVSGEKLRNFIERIERIDEEKKALGEDRKAIVAEAKASGFNTKIMNLQIKRRKAKPHELEDAETTLQMYEHALGAAREPTIFRQIRGLASDDMSLERLIEAWSKLVAPGADVIVRITGGRSVRVWRDQDGAVHHEDYVPPAPDEPEKQKSTLPPREKADVPEVDDAGALQLGREAYKANQPIVTNPFPHDDKRRWKWDEGWRKESGSDGMGEDE